MNKVSSFMKKAVSDEFNTEKLEKAALIRVTNKGQRLVGIKVQFNPQEYSITRQMNYSQKRAVGQDEKSAQIQVICACQSVLQVTLHFDSYSDLDSMKLTDLARPSQALKKAGSMVVPNLHQEVCDCCKEILDLIEFVPAEHTPPQVEFKWGQTDFVGRVMGHKVDYTMFSPSGIPIRARVHLTIIGMDFASSIVSLSQPHESPDRSKSRQLTEGDQLWMIADKEFGDPGMWKTIARENGILNPRAVSGAMRLKVPAI